MTSAVRRLRDHRHQRRSRRPQQLEESQRSANMARSTCRPRVALMRISGRKKMPALQRATAAGPSKLALRCRFCSRELCVANCFRAFFKVLLKLPSRREQGHCLLHPDIGWHCTLRNSGVAAQSWLPLQNQFSATSFGMNFPPSLFQHRWEFQDS